MNVQLRSASSPFLLTILSLGLAFGLSCGAASAAGIFPYRCDKETLPNGLTVLMMPMSTPGLVSYYSVVRTGSRDEVEPGRSGYAHFFEHMMFRGTKRHPGSEYDRIVTTLGAQANAYTSDDLTVFHLTFAKEDLEKVIDIESDRFQHLDYTEPAFQTEAGAVYGELRIDAAQPSFALDEKMHDLAYDAHTYKHTTMGFEADVKAMPKAYQYSRSFYKRFYRPENVVILIVGDFDPKTTLVLMKKYYRDWKRGYEPPKIAPEPPQTAPRSAEVVFPGRTLPILDIAYKCDAFDPKNRDYVAARLLVELAFGPESELYKRLVLREQKVEFLGGETPMNRDPSLLEIAAMVKRPEDVDYVRDEIYRTLEKYKTEPVDRQKLDDLKRRERYGFLMNLDTTEKTAETLVRFIAMTGGIESIDELFAASETVTPDEIMHAARKYFTPERRTVVVLKEKGTRDGERGTRVEKTGRPATPNLSKTQPSDLPVSQSPSLPVSSSVSGLQVSQPPLPLSQCVLLPVKDDPTVSFRLWVKVGSQDDPAGKYGLAAVTAALISDGATRSNTYEQILDKLAPLAAGYSATADTEMTVVAGRVHRDNLASYYPLLLEAICEPAFHQEDLDRVKSRTINYLQKTLHYSSDEELGKAVLYDDIFGGTPYGHLPAGTVDSVKSITPDDVRDFYRRHFTRQNVVIGLGGGYDAALLEKLRADLAALPAGHPAAAPAAMRPKTLAKLVAKLRGKTPAGSPSTQPASVAATPISVPKPIVGRQVTIVEKDCNATAVSVGYPIDVLRGSTDWYALALANCWLGQHRNQNGHLYQVIREARGLNYGDYTYLEHFPNGGGTLVPPVNVARRQQIFELWIRPVPNANRHFALRAALREYQKFVDRGLTQEEFDETKQFLRKFELHLAPTTMERLGYALDDRFYGIDGSHLEIFRRRMDEVTLAEVNAAVKKHLQYENLQIAIVTKDAEAFKKALVEETPSPITYDTPKPESVLAEDREIAVFPLHIKSENIRIVPVGELFVK